MSDFFFFFFQFRTAPRLMQKGLKKQNFMDGYLDFILWRRGVDEQISQIILDFIATNRTALKVRGVLWLVEGENMKTHCGSSALDS